MFLKALQEKLLTKYTKFYFYHFETNNYISFCVVRYLRKKQTKHPKDILM